MIQAGQKFSFGVTYDGPSLYVAAKIFDDSGVSPVLLSTVPMINFYGNSYRGNYIQTTATNLLIQMAVYTDGTYTTLDSSGSWAQADREEQIVDVLGAISNLAKNSVADFEMIIDEAPITQMNLEAIEFTMQIIPEEVIP